MKPLSLLYKVFLSNMSDNFHGLPGITVGLSSTATPRLGLLFLAYAWWGRKLEGHFKKQDINSHLTDLVKYEKKGPQKFRIGF